MMPLCRIILILSLLVTFSKSRKIENSEDAFEYLNRFGYMEDMNMSAVENDLELELEDSDGLEIINEEKGNILREVLKTFQVFAGLKPTGEMNEMTMKKMNMPRCGNKENITVLKNVDLKMDRKFKVHSRWNMLNIYYSIENFPKSGLAPDIVRREIRKAFQLWETATNIKCHEVNRTSKQEVDIEISFVTGGHNDNMAFVKRAAGVAVAHAYFPRPPDRYHHLRGDIHFDDERGWTVETVDGINFFQIATHEIGHALGLQHSSAENAVMNAIPGSNYKPNFGLQDDDIKGIQILYGEKGQLRQVFLPMAQQLKPLNHIWTCYQLANYYGRTHESLQCYLQFTHYILGVGLVSNPYQVQNPRLVKHPRLERRNSVRRKLHIQ